ncbi:uncharacterized protein si:ch211-151h10.2 [Silurus meridionalis]|uniref:uncharacterized protein si:ch211-151h10.2 n=1 Tax=Silurus meridionalis TaxID=175797 RepID=UPI001EEAB7C1|nr:uncharacterized protein si:ch211-151h10.2 [Silurus meridionalis]
MPQLATLDVRDPNGYRKGEREGRKGGDDGEAKNGGVNEQKWSWKNLQWVHRTRWIQYLALVASLWSVIQKEIQILQIGGWLMLVWMLWKGLMLCVSLLKFLYQCGMQYKQKKKFSENSETVRKSTVQPNQACYINQQDAGHMLLLVRALLDGLVVSLLQEQVSDPRVSQIQGLLSKLEAVSRVLTGAVNNSVPTEEQLRQTDNEEDKVIKNKVEDRVKYICTYLQERMSALHFLLQTQDQYGLCIANVQQELQEYWELLEDLHTKVTLQPEKCQGPEDPHTVLTDTEGLYTKLGLFQSRIHECQMLLSTSTHLLEELENRLQALAQTMGLTQKSAWTKDLLQCNTQQFKKVFKDFTSLAQQTQTFEMHLQDLSVSQEKNSIKSSDVEHMQSYLSHPSSLPVYSIALPNEDTSLEHDPRPLHTPSSKFSMINLLCGVRRRR